LLFKAALTVNVVERVAVGRGLGHGVRSDHGASARAVFDDDRLSECLLQIRLQQASDNVLRRTGLRRHDDANGPARVIVGEGAGSTGEHEECDAGTTRLQSGKAEKRT
jgi:hypothetical protein